jgi:hypothetical protein
MRSFTITLHQVSIIYYCILVFQAVVISATCDNVMKLYVNGQLMSEGGPVWEILKQVTINATQPAVVGINCLDTGAPGGIIMSASNNMVTDSSWRCSNTLQDGWNTVSIQMFFVCIFCSVDSLQ